MTPYSQNLYYSAGALSLLVHALFALALVFGVTWRTQPVGPTIAYLWDALPPLPKLELPPPEPRPEAVPESKPEPKPEIKAPEVKAPPPLKVEEPPKPDIALQEEARKRAEAERLEALRRHEEEQRRKEAERLREEERRKEEEQRKAEEAKRQQEEKRKQEEKVQQERRQEERRRHDELRRQETLRQLEEEQKLLDVRRKKEREVARLQMEQELERQLAEELNMEHERLEFTSAALARGKMVLDFQDKIRLKIRGLLRLPPMLKGNPEVVFKVGLLPNGEVDGRPVLVKSSGVPAYDYAVERAIVSASPLPLPPDKAAAEPFIREGLELKFRPQD